MSWSLRRQILILLSIALLVGSCVFLFFTPQIFTTPTCTDQKQNGTETGIDCGGSCSILCTNEAKEPVVLWSRAFQVSNSIYSVSALFENHNDAAQRSLPYEFRIYDDKGVFITRVIGETIVPPSGKYVVVETGIDVGMAKVGKATFEFKNPSSPWEKISDEISKLRISTSNINLDTTALVPKLTATISNPSSNLSISNATISAVLYDANDNVVTVSKTQVSNLSPNSSTQIFFTWPHSIDTPVVRYELIPVIDVFSIQ